MTRNNINGFGVLLALSLIPFAFVPSCKGSGPPPPPPPPPPPRLAYISFLRVPSSATVNEKQKIIATIGEYSEWRLVKEEVAVDEEARLVTITITIQEQYYTFTDLGVSFLSRTASFTGAVDRTYEVTFPSTGMWTVKCNDADKKVAVHGEWLGEERDAKVETFDVQPVFITGKEASARLTILHEDRKWFFKNVEKKIDEENKKVSLRVIEASAESELADEPWSEDVEFGITLFALGEWEITFSSGDFLIRYVQPVPPPTEYGPGQYSDGRLLPPKFILFPDEVYAGERTTCTVVLELREPYERFAGADINYDSANRALYAKVWTLWDYSASGNAGSEYREEIPLIFPEAGQWFIVSSGYYSEQFIKILNVLPARGD